MTFCFKSITFEEKNEFQHLFFYSCYFSVNLVTYGVHAALSYRIRVHFHVDMRKLIKTYR